MSGTEFEAVGGFIERTIAAVEGCKKIYHVCKDKRGLPKEFGKMMGNLSFVTFSLTAAQDAKIRAQDRYEKGNLGEQHKRGILHLTQCMTVGMESCCKNAERLKSIFDSVSPDDENKATPLKRLYNTLSVVRPGLGAQVKEEFEELLQLLRLLNLHPFFRIGDMDIAELSAHDKLVGGAAVGEKLVDIAALGDELNKRWNVRPPVVNELWERTNAYDWTQIMQDDRTTTGSTSSSQVGATYTYHNKDNIIALQAGQNYQYNYR